MTPDDLRALADDIEHDPRIGRIGRLVTAAILRGRADRIESEGKA